MEETLRETRIREMLTHPPIIGGGGDRIVLTPQKEVCEAFETLKFWQHPRFQTIKGVAHTALLFIDYGLHTWEEYQRRGDLGQALFAASITIPIDAFAYGTVLGGVARYAGGPVVRVVGGAIVGSHFIPGYDAQAAAAADRMYLDHLRNGGVMASPQRMMMPSQMHALGQGRKWILQSPGWASEAAINYIDSHYPGFIPSVARSFEDACMQVYKDDFDEDL